MHSSGCGRRNAILLRVEGVGKATRYAVNTPGWEQPALKP
jgi:hypothetical protein